MGQAFARFDDALIDRLFQPLCDLIATYVGLPRTATACLCLDAGCLAWIISRAQAVMDAVDAWRAGSAMFNVAVLLIGLTGLACLRILFRRTGLRQANPLRPGMRPFRAIVMCMLLANLPALQPVALHAWADMLMLVFVAIALYLGACAERPPAARQRTIFAGAVG